MARHAIKSKTNTETVDRDGFVPASVNSDHAIRDDRRERFLSTALSNNSSAKKQRLLLVEDEHEHITLICHAFEKFADSMELTVVNSISKARQVLADKRIDLIITDLSLPDGNGMDLLPGNRDATDTPAIVMTSYGGEELAVETLRSGALDYIVKSSETMRGLPQAAQRALREWKHITERKRAETELLLINSILKTQQEATIDGILVVDERGRIISYNHRLIQMWGIPEDVIETGSDEDFLNFAVTRIVYPEEFVRKVQHLYKNRREKSQIEIELVDGRTFERYSAPMFGPDGQYYGRVWYFRDITERKIAEAELRKNETRLRMVLDATSGGVWDRNLIEDEVYYGLNWATMLGYSPDEIEPHTRFWSNLVHPDDRDNARAALRDHINGHSSHYKAEFRMKAKNGEWKWVLSRGKVVERNENGKPVRILGTHTDISERKRAEQAICEINQQLEQHVKQRTSELLEANEKLCREIHERKSLEKELLDISEREQRWIGQELHDSLGQQLTGIAIMSKVLECLLKSKGIPEATDAARITGLINTSIDQTRNLSKGLHPVDLDIYGLTEALQRLAENTRQTYDIKCKFIGNKDSVVFDNTVSTNLYRIAQEAVTNAVRHGKTKNIRIRLVCKDEKGLLTVENEGVDFPDLPAKRQGMGLKIMKYRAEMIDGTFNIQRSPNGGTFVSCGFINEQKPAEKQCRPEEKQGNSGEKDPSKT